MSPHSFYTPHARAEAAGIDLGLRAYMLSIYNHMGAALALTGLVALLASQTPAFLSLMYVMQNGAIAGMKPLAWVVALAPLGLALALGFAIQRMSLAAARASFWGFAVVMGLSMTTIFLTYTGASIARVFFITAATFGAMSLYGYTTRRDLSGFGSFLIMGVIGLVLASLVNLFLQSTALHFALSALGVLIFTGLTAYDTQKLRLMYDQLTDEGETMAKAVILGALTLYLDFINIFMSLMQFLGERRQ
ncbi:MAG: Bax inhibitor-1/YccA family protein [Alphaproteobacteria bacterium]|nr:Bax inhibitor-1/YccA family protein [Alphaproteobacteria bacterium]